MSFNRIMERAVARKGGIDALSETLPTPLTIGKLSLTPDHRLLAEMTRRVFQAGFVWRVIDNKWDGFEKAFQGFDPERFAALPEEALRPLVQDERIVRNWQKIKTVKVNAEMIVREAEAHGSFAKFIADWPSQEIVDLWAYLKKNGARLGGLTGPMFLRLVGKDTFILTGDVVQALIGCDVVKKTPTSKSDLKRVQQTFNEWASETGMPLSHLSKILACSV